MKKLILILLTITLFSNCKPEGHDEIKCYNSVEKMFPEAIEIKQPIGRKYTFIVKDKDSTIWFVRTMNHGNANVSDKQIIFKK
jgi:hypothetical protein